MSGEKVTYHSYHPEGEACGLLFGELNAESKGVVLLHEWWGIDDFIINTAKQVQDAGFVVLIADIFRGKVFKDPKKARENMMTMDLEKASLDVVAAARYLKNNGSGKVAIIGFAFGGALSLATAALHADADVITAVAPFCGVPKPPVADLSKIKCSVQGHFAAKDKVIGVSSPSDYNAMAETLWGAEVDLEMCIYDAEHAFVNPNYPMYNEAKSKEFYENLFNFLNRQLSLN